MFARSATRAAAASFTSTSVPVDLSKDVTLASPPEDSISSLSFSPKANYLAVGSWDSQVRVYDVAEAATGVGKAVIGFDGPVLSCGWSLDGTKVAGAGTDGTARLLDLAANGAPPRQIAVHSAPIKSMAFFEAPGSNAPMVVTGSWDKTIKYWDLRTELPVATADCKERVYSLDVNEDVMVVATAGEKICLVDLKNPGLITDFRPSSLTSQTRVVKVSRDRKAFVVGGIEGRVAYQTIDLKDTKANFSFKCHRQEVATKTTEIYAVNALCIHPIHGSLATAGADCRLNTWDVAAKVRLGSSSGVGGQISAAGFNGDGSILAYAVSYDWSKGYGFNTPETVKKVMLHPVSEEEVKPRASKVTVASTSRKRY
ncbi:WD40-repeat-containing domain protein [Amylocarpus encephaloides]|uniref:WD40-repeat-containing domain protein n=1 Tax=Amylocarpus encephaloides TaxID=45428 RepID=A0A9P8CAE5_9HELO|nr:WD40-repeat-containing domain protein [Amylocarpus encephaloides]